jgi:hypothetical protein
MNDMCIPNAARTNSSTCDSIYHTRTIFHLRRVSTPIHLAAVADVRQADIGTSLVNQNVIDLTQNAVRGARCQDYKKLVPCLL